MDKICELKQKRFVAGTWLGQFQPARPVMRPIHEEGPTCKLHQTLKFQAHDGKPGTFLTHDGVIFHVRLLMSRSQTCMIVNQMRNEIGLTGDRNNDSRSVSVQECAL